MKIFLHNPFDFHFHNHFHIILGFKNETHRIVIEDTRDLIPKVGGCRVRFQLADRKDAEESLPAPVVIIADGGVLLLARRVQDVYQNILAIEANLLAVAVGFRGIVNLYKVAVHELERERRLAHATRADHNHLVERHLLRLRGSGR